MMELTHNENQVLKRLAGQGWATQRQLKTSRQTMNRLVRAKLVESKLNEKPPRYLPEYGRLYRLKERAV